MSYRFSRECREEVDFTLWVALGTAAFLMIGFPSANYLMSIQEPEAVVLEVEDLHRETGRHRGYFAVVTTEEGTELRVRISSDAYEALQPGDGVPICLGESVLGYEYGWFDQQTYEQMNQ